MSSSLEFKIILIRHDWFFSPRRRVALVKSLVPRIIKPGSQVYTAPEQAAKTTAKAIAPIIGSPPFVVEPSLADIDEQTVAPFMKKVLANDEQAVCVSHRKRLPMIHEGFEEASGSKLALKGAWQRGRNQAVLIDVVRLLSIAVFPIIEEQGD